MITIRDLANELKISYEAVRKSMVRYSTELEGHTFKRGRTTFLDDYAADFLRSKRREQPIVVEVEDTREEVESLRAEISRLKASLLDSKDSIVHLQAKLLESQNKVIEALETQGKYLAYVEMHEATEMALNESQRANTAYKERLTEVSSELAASQSELKTAQNDLLVSRSETEDLRQRLTAAERDAESARAEVESFKPSFFGFYRKR